MNIYICTHCKAESLDDGDEDKECFVCEVGKFKYEGERELSKVERDEIRDDMRGDYEYDEERGK